MHFRDPEDDTGPAGLLRAIVDGPQPPPAAVKGTATDPEHDATVDQVLVQRVAADRKATDDRRSALVSAMTHGRA